MRCYTNLRLPLPFTDTIVLQLGDIILGFEDLVSILHHGHKKVNTVNCS